MKIAIIPARGGSKRVKKKNIKLFEGIPAIGRVITILSKSKIFDIIIVCIVVFKIFIFILHDYLKIIFRYV